MKNAFCYKMQPHLICGLIYVKFNILYIMLKYRYAEFYSEMQ